MRQSVTRSLVLLFVIVTAITGVSLPANAAGAYTCAEGGTILHWPRWDLIDWDFIGFDCTGSGTYDIVITVTGANAGQYTCSTTLRRPGPRAMSDADTFNMQAYDCFRVTP